ncbi:MAG: 3-keto-5-aminohexanoate cleavage protein [Chloroflexota bacterium]|nr:3-keto-5-aminohexanoate cleavage protein [Chloroflexia bacterium]MDQ3227256.1 3-keto-5-aminohexanoate cleavage protein [Chloroflexota bacterium]
MTEPIPQAAALPRDALIISAATTGSWPTKAQNPNVPTTPGEIAGAAIRCGEAGAAIVHIHVRDDEERVTCDPERYAKVRDLVESAGSNVVINMSTGGGAGTSSDEERMAPLVLGPEIASFDCGSVNFGERVFINSPSFLRELAVRMKTYGVKPEIECFEPGHVWNALRLIDDGLLDAPFWFQFVLGVRGGSPPEVKQLQHLVDMLPPGAHWSVCGIGRAQLPLGLAAMAMGGHVRTGLEDNIWYRKGELAVSNAQLVDRVARIAGELGRPLATPDQVRALLGLRGAHTGKPAIIAAGPV